MNRRRAKQSSERFPKKLNPEDVLAHWLVAIETFEQHYSQLHNYTIMDYKEQAYSGNTGQCSMPQLLAMLAQMQDALGNLLLNLNEPDSPDQFSSPHLLEKVADHTLVLEKLNQKAQTFLQLICSSVS